MGRVALALGAELAHARMRDRVKPRARRLVGEHDLRQRRPVQRTVGVDRGGPRRCDLAQTLRAGGDDLAREQVGVDDRGAVFREQRRDRALPRTDPTGQADPQLRHRRSILVA